VAGAAGPIPAGAPTRGCKNLSDWPRRCAALRASARRVPWGFGAFCGPPTRKSVQRARGQQHRPTRRRKRDINYTSGSCFLRAFCRAVGLRVLGLDLCERPRSGAAGTSFSAGRCGARARTAGDRSADVAETGRRRRALGSARRNPVASIFAQISTKDRTPIRRGNRAKGSSGGRAILRSDTHGPTATDRRCPGSFLVSRGQQSPRMERREPSSRSASFLEGPNGATSIFDVRLEAINFSEQETTAPLRADLVSWRSPKAPTTALLTFAVPNPSGRLRPRGDRSDDDPPRRRRASAPSHDPRCPRNEWTHVRLDVILGLTQSSLTVTIGSNPAQELTLQPARDGGGDEHRSLA